VRARASRNTPRIERQVRHLVSLVDDLLDISRITRGKIRLNQVPVEINEVVAKGIELASPLLEQHQHDLSVDVPRRGLGVMGDPARLAQVVSNLLTNAAKYTPAGGRIRVSAALEGDTVSVTVRHRHRHRPRDAAARLRPGREARAADPVLHS
jgi:signal transduction histidine kinase